MHNRSNYGHRRTQSDSIHPYRNTQNQLKIKLHEGTQQAPEIIKYIQDSTRKNKTKTICVQKLQIPRQSEQNNMFAFGRNNGNKQIFVNSKPQNEFLMKIPEAPHKVHKSSSHHNYYSHKDHEKNVSKTKKKNNGKKIRNKNVSQKQFYSTNYSTVKSRNFNEVKKKQILSQKHKQNGPFSNTKNPHKRHCSQKFQCFKDNKQTKDNKRKINDLQQCFYTSGTSNKFSKEKKLSDYYSRKFDKKQSRNKQNKTKRWKHQSCQNYVKSKRPTLQKSEKFSHSSLLTKVKKLSTYREKTKSKEENDNKFISDNLWDQGFITQTVIVSQEKQYCKDKNQIKSKGKNLKKNKIKLKVSQKNKKSMKDMEKKAKILNNQIKNSLSSHYNDKIIFDYPKSCKKGHKNKKLSNEQSNKAHKNNLVMSIHSKGHYQQNQSQKIPGYT